MKKLFLILAICLGLSFTVNADGRRSCSVYNSPYTASISQGSTMVSGDNSSFTIVVTGPKVLEYHKEERITVWVNALDRSTGCIVSTAEVQVRIQYGYSVGTGHGFFQNLQKGVYYNVSIDKATCE